MPGKALHIVKLTENGTYQFNRAALDVLQSSEIKDRYVSVISVAGAFRTGKSFLLDFFLRYLRSNYETKQVDDWLGKDNEPLEGFSWSYGDEANTIGIMMWSEVFLYDPPNGDKLAIILLDTQGTFDHESSMNDCSTIFALSTIISSVQIYNIMQKIMKTDLNYLELFVNYGCMASNGMAPSQRKPFQNLIFLVRDWSWPDSKEFGIDGGEKVLNTSLNNTKGGISNLRSYFDSISCYLMPSPGQAVQRKNFNGCIGALNEDFKTHLKILVPKVLQAKNLVIKEIAGERIRAGQLANYFETYMQIFSSELPNMDDLKAANAIALLATIVDSLRSKYLKKMEKELSENGLCDRDFAITHRNVKDTLLEKFDSKRKLDCSKLTEQYRQKLIEDIKEKYQILQQMNKLLRERYLNNVFDAFAKSYNDIMKRAYIENFITENTLLIVHNGLKDNILSEFHKLESSVSSELYEKFRPKLEHIFDGFDAHKQFNEQRISDAKKLLRNIGEKFYAEHKKHLHDFKSKEKPGAGDKFKDQFHEEHEKEKSKTLKKFKAEVKKFPQELVEEQIALLETALDQLYELFSKPTLLELTTKARAEYDGKMKNPPAITNLKELEKRHLEMKFELLKKCDANKEYEREISCILTDKYAIYESELKMKIETAKSELKMECKLALSKYKDTISSCKIEDELTRKHNQFKKDYLNKLYEKCGSFLAEDFIRIEWKNAEEEIDDCYEKCKTLLNSEIHNEYSNILEIIFTPIGAVLVSMTTAIQNSVEGIMEAALGVANKVGDMVNRFVAVGDKFVDSAGKIVDSVGKAADWFKNLF